MKDTRTPCHQGTEATQSNAGALTAERKSEILATVHLIFFIV